jgi:(2Fe-2S) ferredoxin
MAPFEIHLFVCTSGGTCPHQGAAEVHALLKDAVLRAKLKSKVRVNHAGCLDQCGHGPMMVVYPENVWYAHVSLEDAETIFTEHILGGRPVESLRFHPPCIFQRGLAAMVECDPVPAGIDRLRLGRWRP